MHCVFNVKVGATIVDFPVTIWGKYKSICGCTKCHTLVAVLLFFCQQSAPIKQNIIFKGFLWRETVAM